MKVREGMSMSPQDRLKICVDIGNAIMALHVYGVSFWKNLRFRNLNMRTGVMTPLPVHLYAE
jgi:hypothetical protein